MHPAEWWPEQNVDAAHRAPRWRRSTAARTRSRWPTASGSSTAGLALATGSTPRTLPGTRGHPHARRLQAGGRAAGAGRGKLGVIGGGFIGVEAAASARMKGFDVTMAVAENGGLGAPVRRGGGRLLPAPAGEPRRAACSPARTELPGGRTTTWCWPASASTPNVELAEAAGLEVTTACWSTSSSRRRRRLGGRRHRQLPERGARAPAAGRALGRRAQPGRLRRPRLGGQGGRPVQRRALLLLGHRRLDVDRVRRPGQRQVEVRGSMDDDDFVAYYTDDDGALTACLGVNRSDEVNAAKELITQPRARRRRRGLRRPLATASRPDGGRWRSPRP